MNKVVSSLGALLLLGATMAFGQGPTPMGMSMGGMGGTGGWGMTSPYNRMYNAATAETLRGVVVSVDSFSTMGAMGGAHPMPPMPRMQPGILAMVKTDKETIPVHLGPAWFIENQDTRIVARDSVEVIGSRITFHEKPAIMASEITRGLLDLRLRDNKGTPVWCAWRRQ
jgi:hypothetical protein